MSKYTTEVRWICESKSGYTLDELATKSVDEIIDAAWESIFDFDFDFYNNDWNAKIAKFILKYYYTREIGFETVGLWKLKLNTRIEEITGKYKPMITAISRLVPDDYFQNYKYAGYDNREDDLADHRQDDLQRLRTDELKDLRQDDLKREIDNNQKNKFSDTPQNGLTNVENGSYLSEYRNIVDDNEIKDTGFQSVDHTGTQTTNDTGHQHITHTGTQNKNYGETGYKSDLPVAERIAQFEYERVNILGKIVLEFSDLFFGLW